MLGTMLPVGLVLLPTTARAATGDPSGVDFKLEGQRLNGVWTTGNLLSGWNELDLVPYRITATAGNSAPASQTYKVVVATDYLAGGFFGYDDITDPSVTSGSCSLVSALPAAPGAVQNPGQGGADETLYRTLTITQSANTTCVLNFAARLAVGSHNYPGSSLHVNLENQNLGTSGIGSKEISIPVNAIQPQVLTPTQTAVAGSTHSWLVFKTSDTPNLDFTNTCNTTASQLSSGVNITVHWQKGDAAPSGQVEITTQITATNPAHRTITVDATDVVTYGPGAGDTYTIDTGPVDVPAGQTVALLSTPDVHDVTTSSATMHNSLSASYIDKDTGVPVPGTPPTTFDTTVTTTGGSEANASADIVDKEWMTGSNLSFSVATPASGSFIADPVTHAAAYVAGTQTTGPVWWDSGNVGASGSVTFAKTVYVASATITSGTLADDAALTGSEGFTADSGEFDVGITAEAAGSANVSKSMNKSFIVEKDFTFHLTDSAGTLISGKTATVAIPAGSSSGTSTTVSGLDTTTTYLWNEDATAPFASQTGDGPVSWTLVAGHPATCLTTEVIQNTALGPLVEVAKMTAPDTGTSWTFTLNGPDINAGAGETKTVTATAVGSPTYAAFSNRPGTDGGTYTITETTQTNWDLTNITGDVAGDSSRVTTDKPNHKCSFVLDLSTDANQTIKCAFTNTERGTITIHKTENGAPITGSDAFTFQLRSGASSSSDGTVLDTEVANAGNGGVFSFQVNGTTEIVPGTYQVCEFVNLGWKSTIQGMAGAFVPNSSSSPDSDNAYVCAPITLNAGAEFSLNVDNTPPPGGMAKTIGFWKNWASCAASSGKKAHILDQTMALAEPGGILIGVLTLHGSTSTPNTAPDCLAAVRLLNKSTITSGTKKASDAAFNNVAQLLAYRLNILGGAGDNTVANAAASESQAILAIVGFNGDTHGQLSAAQTKTLNADATILDKFNNNTL